MVKDLAEQVLVSNLDSQKLGLIKISDDNQSEPMFSEHPGSFTNMINSLSALLPDLEGWDKSRHVCSNQEEEDLYDWNTAPEHESKAEYTKDLPPTIKNNCRGESKGI